MKYGGRVAKQMKVRVPRNDEKGYEDHLFSRIFMGING
jgi:hypothetical protein